MNEYNLSLLPSPNPLQLAVLTALWEASVRATHSFLKEEEVEQMRPMVGEFCGKMDALLVAEGTDGTFGGFLGILEGNVEMFFLHPSARGEGLGRRMLTHAVRVYSATSLDVNEENEAALGFYEHLGFVVTGRDEMDAQGWHHPILHMALKEGALL